MAGSVWPILIQGSKTKASDVNNKFAWLERDIVPMHGGTKVDDSYDLGSSAYHWKDLWASRAMSFAEGSSSAPGLTNRGDTAAGIHLPGANQLSIAANGTHVTINKNGQTMFLNAESSAPSLSFVNDQTTGAHIYTSGSLAVVNAGAASMRVDASGRVMKPLSPAFLGLYGGATDATFHPTGTSTLTAWSEEFDRSGDFSDGVFRAPLTGIYKFNVNFGDIRSTLGISGTTSTINTVYLMLVTNARTYGMNIGGQESGSESNEINRSFSVLADMTAGDRAYLTVSMSGSSLGTFSYGVSGTDSIIGGERTSFSGRLIG